MSDRKLSKDEWERYFDFISQDMGEEGRRVEVEVVGLDIGDQIATEWAYLEGLSYDPKDDVFWVHTELLEHQIPHPQEIYVTETGSAVAVVGIKDADGRMQVVKLREPLLLADSRSRTSTKDADEMGRGLFS